MVKFDTIKLGDVCEVLNGDRGHNYPSSTDFVEYGMPFINAGNISEKRVDFDNVDYITKEHYDKLSGAKFRKGDIVICLRGSLGKYALLEFDGGAPASSLAVLRAYAKKLNNHFLFHVLDSNIIEQQINIENNGSSQPNLSAESVKKFIIPLPELSEQMAIAQVLSDINSLIISIQKLIDKKKSIKKGVIQELLTEKRRLPGFSEKWEKKSFIDVFDFMPTNALTRAQMNDTGTVKNIHYGDILTKYGECLDAKDSMIPYIGDDRLVKKYTAFSYVQSGDIIIADTAEDDIVGKAVEVINVNCKMLSGQHTMLCRPKIKFAERFLGYYINSANFHNQMIPYITGIKVSSISKTSMSLLDMQIPSIKEQEEIAKIFSDMDQEIEHLEKKLAKYQQMKQGMLHELLTGHIRLIDTKDQEENETQVSKEKSSKSHNQQFDDAVMIAGIVDAFYSDKYPLGRKKIQKLLYLVRRKEQADISSFHKKAAGPYADTIRYRGGEPIAKNNGYIQETKGKKGSSFSKGDRIQQALDYLREWNKQQDIAWLVSEFKYTKVDELELLATVDMAACDLYQEGKDVTVQTIKNLIQSTKEWRDKLKKDYFSDMDIQRALKKCKEMFHDIF